LFYLTTKERVPLLGLVLKYKSSPGLSELNEKMN
jgi:hypothetical protein